MVQKTIRLLTWMSPGDKTRNQIDYIALDSRFRNSIMKSKTYSGADCDSDHVPVIADVKIQLRKLRKR